MNDITTEYLKCSMDYVYFIENYLTTYDQTKKGNVPFKLFPIQQEILHNFKNSRYNIALKYRQAGLSTITAAYVCWLLLFAEEESPEKVLIVANKRDTAALMLKKINEFITQCPDWMFDVAKEQMYAKSTEFHKIMYNKSEVKAVATSMDALRGYTPTLMIIDEAAHIDNIDVEEFWSASMAALSTGGRAILISTPNGNDLLYWKTYNNAKLGKNKFIINEIKWYQDPRYNINLTWKKDEQEVENWDGTEWVELIKNGWKPTSPWYEGMKAEMDSPRKVSQEIDGNFVGSGNTFVSGEDIDKQERENVCNPIKTEGFDKSVWIFKEPEKDHKYAAGLDISLGQSDDWSVLTIIDFDTWEQVFEWRGKMAPDVVAEFILKYLNMYGNPMLITDLTGGLGLICVNKLKEFEYKNFFYDYKGKDMYGYINKNDLPAGLVIGSSITRMNILDAFERNIRQGFKVRSHRVLSEMRTFIVTVTGRPDHMKGCNDDSLFSLALALYLCEVRFKDLTKNESQIKSLLNSWTVETTITGVPTYNMQDKMNPLGGQTNQRQNQNDFGWLLGVK
jgi:hypothetical protein